MTRVAVALHSRQSLSDRLGNNRTCAERNRLFAFARPNRVNRTERRVKGIILRRRAVLALNYAPRFRYADDTKNIMVKIANPSRFQSLALAIIALNNRLRQVTNDVPRKPIHRRELNDSLRLRIAAKYDAMLVPHIVNLDDLTRQ